MRCISRESGKLTYLGWILFIDRSCPLYSFQRTDQKTFNLWITTSNPFLLTLWWFILTVMVKSSSLQNKNIWVTLFCFCIDLTLPCFSIKPGDTWESGCQQCTCDMDSMIVQCQPITCPTPATPICNETGYRLVNKAEGCCQKYTCGEWWSRPFSKSLESQLLFIQY